MNPDDEFDENHLLTEVDMLEYMSGKTQQNLDDALHKINNLQGTQHKLKGLLATPEAPQFVPLCGGIGYYEGVIKNTNDVLVLLGENWFAQRTVSQATDILERRLEYLRREKKVLETEMDSIGMRKNLLVSEGFIGEDDDITVAKNNEDGVDGDDEEAFCEEDDLTVEELADLEEELGDDIEDDELVDQRMFDMMNTKRRARLARSAKTKKVADPVPQATPVVKSADDQEVTTKKHVRFADPSQIGVGQPVQPDAPPVAVAERKVEAPAPTTTASSAVSDGVVERGGQDAPNRGVGQRAVGAGAPGKKKKSLFAQGLQ